MWRRKLFRELLGLHLKAVMPAPSALISRFMKTKTWSFFGGMKSVSNFQVMFVFMLTLPAYLACSSFCLLALEIFIEAVVLQLGCGFARLTKAIPFRLSRAPLITLNPLQGDCLLLYRGAARTGELGVKDEGREDRTVASLARPLSHSTEAR